MSDIKKQTTDHESISRRTILRWVVGIGAVSSMGAMASVLATVKPADKLINTEIQTGDLLVFALGRNKGHPIHHTSIVPGQAALVFPQGKEFQDNLLMILHLNETALIAPTNLDWTIEGMVGYSAICPHLGCTVNFSHEGMAGADYPHIHCPCHAAMFNPQAGGGVIGGPAPRPLPQLPLAFNTNGELVASGPFSEPIGVI
jgi:rieske iron-sulfur protein